MVAAPWSSRLERRVSELVERNAEVEQSHADMLTDRAQYQQREGESLAFTQRISNINSLLQSDNLSLRTEVWTPCTYFCLFLFSPMISALHTEVLPIPLFFLFSMCWHSGKIISDLKYVDLLGIFLSDFQVYAAKG